LSFHKDNKEFSFVGGDSSSGWLGVVLTCDFLLKKVDISNKS
jgi:hypothetical protein